MLAELRALLVDALDGVAKPALYVDPSAFRCGASSPLAPTEPNRTGELCGDEVELSPPCPAPARSST
jgi:hypothetical protein